eukprot:CAMPEP_0197080046 /NCGR_PEP_ID=MMETSP1384-20130603/213929_1 /TAXON_ID=29189 /ORGANISM="Ammonia sp." /LENGTH=1020 /DNA_ID=CAMNT_0042518927 /DNA_START=57 /DNA_END=3121 /DNA_ORIENTATION=-
MSLFDELPLQRKPKWLIVDDIMLENKRLHYHIGWLCVALPLLVHAWLVFLPLFKAGNSLTMHHQWMRPIDEQTGFYLDNYHEHHINIAYNDLYALLVVTLCFMLFFPLSMSAKLREKRYTLAVYLHLIAAALYGVELIRTPFTIHCWFFCAPIMALYVMDRMYGMFWYRVTSEAKLICKYSIDSDYVVLFLHVPHLPPPETMQCDFKVFGKRLLFERGAVRQTPPIRASVYDVLQSLNELYGDIESSFLFSSSMRHTLSHRSHRFPIRTHANHQHVASHEFQSSLATEKCGKSQQQTFTLMRTDTALTGLSLSGLRINEEDAETPHNSPSESAKAHHIYLQNMLAQQSRLRKLSEHNEPEQSYQHQRSEALSVVRSGTGRHDKKYIMSSNLSTPSFGASGIPQHFVDAPPLNQLQPTIPPVPKPRKRQRHVRSFQKEVVILPMSNPLTSPRMLSTTKSAHRAHSDEEDEDEETEDDDTVSEQHSHDDEDEDDGGDFDREPLHEDTVDSPTINTLVTLPTAVAPSYVGGHRESYQDGTMCGSLETDLTHNIGHVTVGAAGFGGYPYKSPTPFNAQSLEHCKSTTLQSVTITYHNTKPLRQMGSLNPSSKPSTRGPSFDTVIEEVVDQMNAEQTIAATSIIEEDRSSDDANDTEKISLPRPRTTMHTFQTLSVHKSDQPDAASSGIGGHSLQRSRATMRSTRSTQRRSTVKTYASELTTRKSKTTCTKFGSVSQPQTQTRWREKDLWIDEKTKEQFEWNVGVIMKVHQKQNGMSFTQYVRDALGFCFATVGKHEENHSRSEHSKSPKSDSKGGYVRCQMDEKCEAAKAESVNSNRSYTNMSADGHGQKHQATHLYCYGPYRSGFGHVMTECLRNHNPVVLIGTGAGVGYILDFLMETRSRNIDAFPSRVDIHFSCRSVKFFQWVTDVICGPKVKQQDGLHINAHLTGYENVVDYHEAKRYDDEFYYKKKRNAKIGRASFQSVLRNAIVNTKVFFCGNATIQHELQQLCQQLNLKLYKSHVFQ